MLYPHACLVLFAKAPVPGQVKTRLIPALGAAGACGVHEQLLGQVLQVLDRNTLCAQELWVDQLPAHPAFASFKGPVCTQQGQDLGARLSHALQQVQLRYKQDIFIGTDCPALDINYLEQALVALQSGAQLVVGPAADGGYVLLGCSGFHAGLFEGIDWGTSAVLSQTLQQAERLQLDYAVLATLSDLDRPEDLQLLQQVNAGT
jgi:rSAM/selenodomain-associated transferase 1